MVDANETTLALTCTVKLKTLKLYVSHNKYVSYMYVRMDRRNRLLICLVPDPKRGGDEILGLGCSNGW